MLHDFGGCAMKVYASSIHLEYYKGRHFWGTQCIWTINLDDQLQYVVSASLYELEKPCCDLFLKNQPSLT